MGNDHAVFTTEFLPAYCHFPLRLVFGCLTRFPRRRGNKVDEFRKINSEWTDLISNLGALKSEYAATTNVARKAEIHKQYDEGVEKAKGLEGKLVTAAEGAYTEAPNADRKITDLLIVILGDRVSRDDFESAFKLGKLLMDNKCTDKFVPAMAGVAAYCVNEYDLAGPWLSYRRRHPACA